MAGSITHFEIYGEKPSKLADFYQSLLGWEIERSPGIDYWRIRTEPKTGRGFDGGLTYCPLPGLRNRMHYVKVESLDVAINLVQRLGGDVLRPKTALPKTAWCALVTDPAGNIFGLWQADHLAFPLPEPD
jgi:hypothetical protein